MNSFKHILQSLKQPLNCVKRDAINAISKEKNKVKHSIIWQRQKTWVKNKAKAKYQKQRARRIENSSIQ